jgi:hypothetical protein
MKNLFWTGYCNADRMIAIGEIEKIVSGSGYIVDFRQFSDISITIVIELEECKVDLLYLALSRYMSLNDFEPINTDSAVACTVFLNTSFARGTGDLRIETPAVPG